MQSIYNHGPDEESETTLIEDLEGKLCLTQESCTQNNPISEEEEDEQEEEEEFSFMCGGGNSSPIAAEDAFINGQIKPVFPLFNRDLLLGEIPQVKKMFVEGISGPCCEWSKESSSSSSAAEVAVAPELSKKSNSTGFSKLWRFRDLLSRSNSDGRDAFVFLNNQETTSSSSSSEVRKEDEKKLKNQETTSSSSSFEVRKEEKKLKNHETTSSDEKKVKGKKKSVKSKTTTLSPHEIYLKSKAKGDDRRRSYLPYRPEVFGFFTNVNGGMSRNVHPF